MQLFASFRVLLLLSLMSSVMFASHAAAQQPRMVYEGRYLITPKEVPAGPRTAGVVLDTDSISRRGLNIEKPLGGKQVLVNNRGPRAASIGGEARVVAYDANDDICPELVNSGAVQSCSPDYQVHTTAIPNDTSYGSLWGLGAAAGIDAPRAWDVTTGEHSVVVAVIDTGIDYNHPDLAANIWSNPNEIPGNGIDDDHNGVIDDVHGANFTGVSGSMRGNPMDNNSHGTHVAGTIGAVGNNARGVVGVSWKVKLLGIKFLDANGSGSLSGAIQAINYMVSLKQAGINIRISNNSWGGAGYSQPLYDAIKAARDAGIIFVAAAGNEANDNDAEASYPASYDLSNIVSVAALDQNRNLASFSNYGASKVDIAAPGVGILSTVPGNSYASYSGTSMATPHVAGALALLLSREPSLNMSQSIARLYASGVPLPSLQGVISTGRALNVARLVHDETSPLPEATPPPAPCHYSMEEIAYTPDLSMAERPIVLQEDEFNYYSLNLPFAFPYYRGSVSAVHISPNGVVYTKSAPNSMDYRNGSQAPLNAIAALQTDMIALPGTNDGVRVRSESDKVTIFWDQKAYDARKAGNVKVWLVLHANGVIDEFVSFDSKAVQSAVRSAATIGLGGQTSDMLDTYAVNSSSIRNGLALRYTPRCGEHDVDTAVVKKVKVRSTNGSRIKPGQRVAVRISGTGYGHVQVSAAFNGQSCSASTAGYLADGKLRMSGRLPKQRFAQFAVSVNGKKASMRVNAATSRGKNRRLSASALRSACNRFLGSLR